MFGKPVIRGTQITVEQILRCFAAGETVEEIIVNYLPLTAENIRGAQAFAADHLALEQIFAAE